MSANISIYMKPATLVFLLTICATVTRAQSSTAPSGDVTIGMFEGTPEYCLGEVPFLFSEEDHSDALTISRFSSV